jgi:hypothetical protein
VRLGVLILAPLMVGCAPRAVPSVEPASDACRLFAGATERLDTVTVALPEAGSARNSLAPANDSDRLLFRMTLDTPIRLDCRGSARPGLASSWSRDATGRTWTITLREDARGYDGLPLTAARMAAAWSERGLVGTTGVVDSLVVLDDRTLAVTLRQVGDSVPSILADPAFSLPLAVEQRPAGVKFEQLTGGDARDALDRGTDILVTRNPAVVEYVAGQPEFVSFALPWTRTYVLLEPGNRSGSLAHVLSDPQVQRSLTEAARVDARAAEPPFWWSELSRCPVDTAAESQQRSSRVVYVEGDDVGRRLAERVVALTPPGTDVRTAALKPAELDSALRTGSERAFVLAVPRRSLVPCRDSSGWPRAATMVPLIDSRAFLIVRRGSPPVTVEWDGTIRIEGTKGPSPP